MSKISRRLFVLFCALALLVSIPGLSAMTVRDADAGEDGAGEGQVVACTEIPLFIDADYIGSALVINSVPYVAFLAFTECILNDDCDAHWDQDTGTAVITCGVVEMQLTTDDPYIIVNGRYLPLENDVYNINGTVMIPLRVLAKIFNLNLSVDRNAWCIRIDTGNMMLLESGKDFYRKEDLYWLSRVISAEAGNQPLEGMIGVGNVVLNRVSDDSGEFPDTVKEVIFQPGQFDVVRNATVYADPVDMAVIAAKLCIEGFNTVGESKWFVNPTIGHVHWFYINRTFEVSIADHLFYT